MPDTFKPRSTSRLTSFRHTSRWKGHLLKTSREQPLDRVNVLGDEDTGHSGCVNALSWAKDGEVLLSGGDDRTVRIWRIDPSITATEYPFVCDAVIKTGHRGNIFNAHLLPQSSRIATVARDGQVRILDVGGVMDQSVTGREAVYTPRQTNCRVLRCHDDAVKRIVTEYSPDLFLTVSEDGAVRQHDLRTHHVCSEGHCPTPLVQMRHPLSTIALSPLTPYQFVVAGESSHGYLFDRRQSGRHISYEWGMSPEPDSLTTCVRRFGRESSAPGETKGFEHITGARMAKSNGHEVLLSYSSDAVYLYSTQDDPRTSPSKETGILPPNKRPRVRPTIQSPLERPATSSSALGSLVPDTVMEEDIDRYMDEVEDEDSSGSSSDGVIHDSGVDDQEQEQESPRYPEFYPNVPVVLPRNRFAGACNVETVKDVNFLGPDDEFVASGSDDGYFFLWEKSSGKLHDILEGDGSVVNVIEDHPYLPLVAVSGIDMTVKLFAPAHGLRTFSRVQNANDIIQHNTQAALRAGSNGHVLFSGQRVGCVHQ